MKVTESTELLCAAEGNSTVQRRVTTTKVSKKMYLHVSVLGLFGMESLLKNKTLGDVQSSGHLLLEDESCYKQQVYN